ncbi:hypothetical protein [Cytobacillus gottheilii]|uniref:Uncharacterized protein n=1 Tax=Cytobacillus gottheilii TaxID=859144 RepID=A0ABX8FIV0_9BACI|nr:hypothetical protein [Cytobacillus gottheilii]QVY63972.1 hypothetical protein J1899_22300 [Cytobacillus gottheilii]
MWDKLKVLADFLQTDEAELKMWNDDSITFYNNDRFEYILKRRKSNTYMEFLGKHKGFFIYKN